MSAWRWREALDANPSWSFIKKGGKQPPNPPPPARSQPDIPSSPVVGAWETNAGWVLRMTATDLEHQARTLEASAKRLRDRARVVREMATHIDGSQS